MFANQGAHISVHIWIYYYKLVLGEGAKPDPWSEIMKFL